MSVATRRYHGRRDHTGFRQIQPTEQHVAPLSGHWTEQAHTVASPHVTQHRGGGGFTPFIPSCAAAAAGWQEGWLLCASTEGEVVASADEESPALDA